jgi:hypothetical protein
VIDLLSVLGVDGVLLILTAGILLYGVLTP